MDIKDFTEAHWQMVKDYCDGVRLRDICAKYNCHDSKIVNCCKIVGITPRPMGFANYQTAHEWVLNAREQYSAACPKQA